MNENLSQELLRLKKQLDESNIRLGILVDNLRKLKEEMKTKFGVSNLEEAMKLSKKMEREIQQLEDTLSEEVNDLTDQINGITTEN